MAVEIDELSTTVDVVARLTPQTRDEIVRAVLVALDNRQTQRDTLAADVSLLPVVEQQRSGKG